MTPERWESAAARCYVRHDGTGLAICRTCAETIATLTAADEREACAKVADAIESAERQTGAAVFGTMHEPAIVRAANVARSIGIAIRRRAVAL